MSGGHVPGLDGDVFVQAVSAGILLSAARQLGVRLVSSAREHSLYRKQKLLLHGGVSSAQAGRSLFLRGYLTRGLFQVLS
jgi:hypothetical protein